MLFYRYQVLAPLILPNTLTSLSATRHYP